MKPPEYPIVLGNVSGPGGYVWRIQHQLRTLGYECPTSGVMCQETISAVNAWKAKHDLLPDGQVDARTWRELMATLPGGMPAVKE